MLKGASNASECPDDGLLRRSPLAWPWEASTERADGRADDPGRWSGLGLELLPARGAQEINRKGEFSRYEVVRVPRPNTTENEVLLGVVGRRYQRCRFPKIALHTLEIDFRKTDQRITPLKTKGLIAGLNPLRLMRASFLQLFWQDQR
jgi:hypothetical protein